MAKKKSLVDMAYAEIKDDIISYKLKPGIQISDNTLATEFGISRAPVREAISQLVSDGLVESVNGKLFVTHIGLQDIIDILQLRRAIETEAVRVVAENGWLTKEQEQQFNNSYELLISSVTTDSMIEDSKHDEDFHMTIIRFSGNQRMLQVSRRVNLQMQRARWLNIAVPMRQHASKIEHEEIHKAIIARHESCAVAAVETHLRNTEQCFQRVFNDSTLKQILAGIYSFYN